MSKDLNIHSTNADWREELVSMDVWWTQSIATEQEKNTWTGSKKVKNKTFREAKDRSHLVRNLIAIRKTLQHNSLHQCHAATPSARESPTMSHAVHLKMQPSWHGWTCHSKKMCLVHQRKSCNSKTIDSNVPILNSDNITCCDCGHDFRCDDLARSVNQQQKSLPKHKWSQMQKQQLLAWCLTWSTVMPNAKRASFVVLKSKNSTICKSVSLCTSA